MLTLRTIFSPKKFLQHLASANLPKAHSRPSNGKNSVILSPLPYLNLVLPLAVLVDADVDGEMGVDVAHLVLEAAGHADDHIADESADGTEGGDVLTRAMVELDDDRLLVGLFEADGQM